MRAGYAFFRLALRPGVLFGDLFVLTALSAVVIVLSGSLAGSLFGIPDIERGGRVPLVGPTQLPHQLLLLVPAAVGTLTAYMVRGLLISHISWTLPRARRRLAGPFLLTGAAASAAAAGLAHGLGAELHFVPALALAWLSFAAGTALFDFTLSRPTAWGVALSLFAAIFAADELLPLAGTHSLAAVTAAALLSPALLSVQLGAARHRRRVLVPSEALGLDYAPVVSPDRRAPRVRGRAATALWPPRRLRGLVDWVRASAYEVTGVAPLGALGGPLFIAAVATLVLVVIAYQDGFEIEGSSRRGLAFVYHALCHPAEGPAGTTNRPPYASLYLVAAATAGAQALMAPLVLRRGVVYPLSRAARARVAFGAALFQSALVALALTITLGLTAELVLRLGDFPRPALVPPTWLRAALLAAALMPALHWVRFRWLSPCRGGFPQLVAGGVMGASILVLSLLAWRIQQLWRASEEAAPLSTPAALLALAAAGQLAYAAALRRRYARCDLV